MQAGITGNNSGDNSKERPDCTSNLKKDGDNSEDKEEDLSIENVNSDSKNDLKIVDSKNDNEEPMEGSSLINISNAITNSLLNQIENNSKNQDDFNSPNADNKINDYNKDEIFDDFVEEEEVVEGEKEEENEKLSQDSKKENLQQKDFDEEEELVEEKEGEGEKEEKNEKLSQDDKKENLQQKDFDEEEELVEEKDAKEKDEHISKNDTQQHTINKAISSENPEKNILQNITKQITEQLILKKNEKSSDEYEYEEEEEEEEEEDNEETPTKNIPGKHLPPAHLLEAHQIPQKKKTGNDSIEDLENEVMITGVATPKTDIDEDENDENNNDIKKDEKTKNKKITKKSSTGNKTNCNNNLDEADLDRELKKFLKTKKPPDISIRAEVTELARQKTLQLMLEEDYDNASKMQLAAEQLSMNIKVDKRVLNEKEIKEVIEERISGANQQQKDINYKYIDKIEEFEKLQKLSREKLSEKHQHEIDTFLNEWDNEKKLIPFLKQSPKLLQLRQMQKSQAMTLNFAQAKQLKKAADKLQKDETQIAKVNASNAMKAEYDALLKQQQKEVELWTQNWQRKKQIIETERKQEEEANENLRNQLNNKLKGPKMPKRQSVMLPINSTPRGSSILITRTNVKSMMIEYRSKTAAARLDLRPAEVKAIVKPKLQTPRKLTSSFS